MTPALSTKTILFSTSGLLVLCLGLAAYLQQPYVLLAAPMAFAVMYLLQKPKRLLFCLLALIPWSGEVKLANGFSTDLPDEPLMLLTALVAVCGIIYQRKKFTSVRFHPLVLLLALQFLWTVVTVISSTHPLLSVKYSLAKTWYLLAFVAAPVLLWRTKEDWKQCVIVFYSSTVAVVAVTMVRHGFLGFSFSTINPALEPFFRNHVTYSSLLVFVIPLGYFLYRQSPQKKAKQWLAASILLLLVALYFAFARGAWLALFIGAAAYGLLIVRKLVAGYIIALATALIALVTLANNNRYLTFAHDFNTTIFHENFQEHLAATYQLKDLSTAERFHRWVAAVRMAPERWHTGFGPTTFYQHYKSYTVPAFKTWVSKNEEQSTVHNYFLLLLVEQGGLGLVLFLVLLGALFWKAQRLYHRTDDPFWKAAAAVVAMVIAMQCTVNSLSDLIETDKTGSVFYLCVAVLIVGDRMMQMKDANTN